MFHPRNVARISGVAILAVLSLATVAAAVPVLDQENSVGGLGGLVVTSNQTVGQSFTVGLVGTLASFSVKLADTQAVDTALLTWHIRTSASGSDLASGTLSHGDVPDLLALVSVDVSSFALGVSVGDELFIVLTTTDAGVGTCSPYCWDGGISDPVDLYAGGQTFVNGSANSIRDMVFQTFVDTGTSPVPDVPEPSSLVLLGTAAGLALGRWTRSRRKK